MPGASRGREPMRVFRACPAPDSRLSAARRGQIPGLLEIKIPLLMGRKKSDAAVFCENRLENVRCFRYLRMKLPTLTVEITAELTAELTAE